MAARLGPNVTGQVGISAGNSADFRALVLPSAFNRPALTCGITGPNAEYFKMLAASNSGAKYYFGIPLQVMQGKPKEVFTQVINNAFPAGTIDVDGVVKQMTAAY